MTRFAQQQEGNAVTFHHPASSKGKKHIKNTGVDTDTACALNDLTDCDRAQTERMNGSTI